MDEDPRQRDLRMPPLPMEFPPHSKQSTNSTPFPVPCAKAKKPSRCPGRTLREIENIGTSAFKPRERRKNKKQKKKNLVVHHLRKLGVEISYAAACKDVRRHVGCVDINVAPALPRLLTTVSADTDPIFPIATAPQIEVHFHS
jgi:hypothetical protein